MNDVVCCSARWSYVIGRLDSNRSSFVRLYEITRDVSYSSIILSVETIRIPRGTAGRRAELMYTLRRVLTLICRQT